MDYKEYLQKDILDFWLKNAIDNEKGGIFTCLDRYGKVYGEEKSVWFQGRALWSFAKAYNYIEKKNEYLEAGHKIFNFLPLCGDVSYRMDFMVTRDGNTIQRRRYYFSETFAAIGCAEYYKATGNKKALEMAEQYFNVAYKLFKNPQLTQPKYHSSAKALSPVMIMMSTAQTMRSIVSDNPMYDEIVRELAEEIVEGGFLSSSVNALLESVSEEGKFINTPSGRVVNPGHSLEAAWFLMSEGVYSNCEKLLLAGKKIIDITMDKGVDKKNGGIIAFRDVLDQPPLQLEWDMKLWWPQCEGIIANLLAYKIFGKEEYNDNYQMLMKYAFDHFADTEYGEWYGYLHYDNSPANYLKGNMFKGPFHLPRMLMIVDSLEKGKCISKFMI